MIFNFSRDGLNKNEQKTQRFFEMVPGLCSWTILLGLIALSVSKPLMAALFIIAFDFFWFLRLIYMTIFLVLSYFRLSIEDNVEWMDRVNAVDRLKETIKEFQIPKTLKLKQRYSTRIHRSELLRLYKSNALPPASKDIAHLVILPVAKESSEIVVPSIESLCTQKFPPKQIVVMIALEDRADQKIKDSITKLEQQYKDTFMDFMVILHPSDLPGEKRVKGANASWAAKKAKDYFSEKSIPFENIVVSCFDSDTIVSPQYFACLTYYFMITPFRTCASFQPIPVYHNNIWDVPGFARVMETGSSFFQLIESTNPEKLVTFSSHSMSFKALVDVDYWPVDMISDDSAIFWKSFIHYDGKYRVVPMYITLSMDIIASDSIWETAKSIYKQKRRWAWGVENFPIMMRAFCSSKKISLYDKLRYGFKLLEGHISWATWGFILTFLSWLPAFFTNKAAETSVVYYNAPYIAGTIFHLASFSLFISIILSLMLLPKENVRHSLLKRVAFAIQWLMIPFILVFLSALPALDAQTRMLLGKRLDFWVANKRKT